MNDLEYKHLGLFTAFYPVTEEGIKLFNEELAEVTHGTGKVLSIQLPNVIHALERAGYKVGKYKEVESNLDDIYNELK